MPTVKSKIKEALEEALKDASDCMLKFPEERSAIRYANTIHKLIDICEERKRY